MNTGRSGKLEPSIFIPVTTPVWCFKLVPEYVYFMFLKKCNAPKSFGELVTGFHQYTLLHILQPCEEPA